MSAIPPGGATATGGGDSLADAVLMVRPAAFGPNLETAASNRFQTVTDSEPGLAARACAEFDRLAASLAAAGVDVITAEDTAAPVKPDAVFPNNWMSTHRDGLMVLYPMLAPTRRTERRPERVAELAAGHGRLLTAVLDLSHWERQGLALEGTGSLVLDRRQRVAYAARSSRTAEAPLAQWARLMGYEVECFAATDADGIAIYHTNVMLSIGDRFAVAALTSIADPVERGRVRARLEAGGRELLEIDRDQMARFGANVLQLAGSSGPIIALSTAAREGLGPALIARLERHGRIVAAPIPTIERFGGGSVRCMLAEIFLPTAGG